MRVSVLVPSYRRPDSLSRCLAALAAQTRLPDEVVVGVRSGDEQTLRVIDEARRTGAPVRVSTTTAPGVVAAMQAALDVAEGDIIALTDDDARPFPNWIAGLLIHYETSADVGGVGGRDWQPRERGNAARVGIAQWFGRVVGNHHLGVGPARTVDILKGVNCSFREPLLRAVGFDTRLRGDGAQLYWEMGVCLPIRRAGWRLVYDPEVAVEHDVAPRHDSDNLHRGVFAEGPLRDAVHNETIELLGDASAARSIVIMLWAFLIGTGEAPGIGQTLRNLFRGDVHALQRWRATQRGRWDGLVTLRQKPRHPMVPFPASE